MLPSRNEDFFIASNRVGSADFQTDLEYRFNWNSFDLVKQRTQNNNASFASASMTFQKYRQSDGRLLKSIAFGINRRGSGGETITEGRVSLSEEIGRYIHCGAIEVRVDRETSPISDILLALGEPNEMIHRMDSHRVSAVAAITDLDLNPINIVGASCGSIVSSEGARVEAQSLYLDDDGSTNIILLIRRQYALASDFTFNVSYTKAVGADETGLEITVPSGSGDFNYAAVVGVRLDPSQNLVGDYLITEGDRGGEVLFSSKNSNRVMFNDQYIIEPIIIYQNREIFWKGASLEVYTGNNIGSGLISYNKINYDLNWYKRPRVVLISDGTTEDINAEVTHHNLEYISETTLRTSIQVKITGGESTHGLLLGEGEAGEEVIQFVTPAGFSTDIEIVSLVADFDAATGEYVAGSAIQIDSSTAPSHTIQMKPKVLNFKTSAFNYATKDTEGYQAIAFEKSTEATFVTSPNAADEQQLDSGTWNYVSAWSGDDWAWNAKFRLVDNAASVADNIKVGDVVVDSTGVYVSVAFAPKGTVLNATFEIYNSDGTLATSHDYRLAGSVLPLEFAVLKWNLDGTFAGRSAASESKTVGAPVKTNYDTPKLIKDGTNLYLQYTMIMDPTTPEGVIMYTGEDGEIDYTSSSNESHHTFIAKFDENLNCTQGNVVSGLIGGTINPKGLAISNGALIALEQISMPPGGSNQVDFNKLNGPSISSSLSPRFNGVDHTGTASSSANILELDTTNLHVSETRTIRDQSSSNSTVVDTIISDSDNLYFDGYVIPEDTTFDGMRPEVGNKDLGTISLFQNQFNNNGYSENRGYSFKLDNSLTFDWDTLPYNDKDANVLFERTTSAFANNTHYLFGYVTGKIDFYDGYEFYGRDNAGGIADPYIILQRPSDGQVLNIRRLTTCVFETTSTGVNTIINSITPTTNGNLNVVFYTDNLDANFRLVIDPEGSSETITSANPLNSQFAGVNVYSIQLDPNGKYIPNSKKHLLSLENAAILNNLNVGYG